MWSLQGPVCMKVGVVGKYMLLGRGRGGDGRGWDGLGGLFFLEIDGGGGGGQGSLGGYGCGGGGGKLCWSIRSSPSPRAKAASLYIAISSRVSPLLSLPYFVHSYIKLPTRK